MTCDRPGVRLCRRCQLSVTADDDVWFMHIAIFSEVYWPMVSGVSLVVQRLATAMERRGHVVRVYAPNYPTPAGSSDNPHTFRVRGKRFFLYPDVQWGVPHWPAITKDFADFRPDVVHVATEFAMGTTGLRLARDHGVPVIASAHTDYERYASRYNLDWLMGAGWSYLRWFYGRAERVLCPSRQYERHLNLRGVRHTGIWTRGVDLDDFGPAHRSEQVRASFGILPHQPMVLYVGRLAVEKNLHLLLDAWRQLEGRRRDARLVIVGTGPLEASLAAAAPRDVIVAGVRTGRELSAVYASADCFVFPSSTETFGNVLLEAMASGLPSIAVGAGGVLDFAQHGSNAWMVEPDSAAALAQGLSALLWDRMLCAQLGAGGQATARSRDWDNIFDGVAAGYERARATPAARRAA